MRQKFEEAFEVMKDLYMFMHEDKEALYFKHTITRIYTSTKVRRIIYVVFSTKWTRTTVRTTDG